MLFRNSYDIHTHNKQVQTSEILKNQRGHGPLRVRDKVVQFRNTRFPKSPSPATIVSESPIFMTARPPGVLGGTFQGNQCLRVRHSPRSTQQLPGSLLPLMPPFPNTLANKEELDVADGSGGAEGGNRNFCAPCTRATSSGTHLERPLPATALGCSKLGKSCGSLMGCKRWGTIYGCGQCDLSGLERPLVTAGETAARLLGSVARAKSPTESLECTTLCVSRTANRKREK